MIVLLKDECSFRPIKNNEVSNIYRSVVDWPKIKHLRYQQLLCSSKPCPNKRPEIDNLIVKVTFYGNVGNAIIGFCNVMVELKLIISFIDNKNIIKRIFFSQNCTKSVVANHFIRMKGKIINHFQKIFKTT